MEQDYSGWRLLPFVSIKSEMIRTIEQFDSAIKNGEAGISVAGKNATLNANDSFNAMEEKGQELVFHKGDVAVAGTCFDIDGTDFALSLLKRFASQKVSTGFIAAGSTDYETIGQKLVSFSAVVSSEKIKSAKMKSEDFKKIQAAAGELYESPVMIKCSPNCSIERVEFFVEKMMEEQPLDVVIIDGFEYIKELAVIDEDDAENYHVYLEEVMESFSELAKKNNIAVILITEASSVWTGERPGLKCFRKKMVIPNGADMVLLLYNDKVSYRLIKNDKEEADENCDGEKWVAQRSSEGQWDSAVEDASLFIAKNKRSGLGVIPLKRNNLTGEYIF